MGRFLMTKRGLNNVHSEEASSEIPKDLDEAIDVGSKKESRKILADLETKIYQSRIPTFYAEKTVNETGNVSVENEVSILQRTPEEVAEVIQMQQEKIENSVPRKKTLQHNKSGSSIPRKSFGEKQQQNGSGVNLVGGNEDNPSVSLVASKQQQETSGKRSFSNKRQNKSASSIPRRSFGENQHPNRIGNKSFGENEDKTSGILIPRKSFGENQEQNTSGSLIPKMSPRENEENIEGTLLSVEEDTQDNSTPKKSLKNSQGSVSLIPGVTSRRNQDTIDENLLPKNTLLENHEKTSKSLIPKKSMEENTNSGLILKNALEEKQSNVPGSLIPRKSAEKANVRELAGSNVRGELACCSFCGEKLLFLERVCAEGKTFHRACFRCNYCNIQLR